MTGRDFFDPNWTVADCSTLRYLTGPPIKIQETLCIDHRSSPLRREVRVA